MNILKYIFGVLKEKDESNKLSPKDVRIGLISSILVYGGFGVVDWFMMPENYLQIWLLRFFLIIPAVFIFTLLSYNQNFFRNIKIWLTLLIISGIIGVDTMIIIAEKNEVAYYEYYAGLILIIMWAAFVFRLSLNQMIIICIQTSGK